MTDQAPALPGGLADYAAQATALLPPGPAAYFLRGAGAEDTCRANLRDLEAIRIWPRALAPIAGGHTRLTLLGQSLDAPMLVAPMAYLRVLDAGGEAGVAAAATAQGLGMCLSAQAGQPMEAVRDVGPACRWMQLYWQAGRAPTMALAERAARAGFTALVLTVDAPVNGIRDAEIASGFALPDGLRAVNLDGLPQPQFAPLQDRESLLFDRVAHVLPDWEDVAWFCANAPLPVLLKGILHPDDATQAVKTGAAGIIVSNHGGRVLDGAPSAIAALPGVVAQVGGAVPVLMDGGIRRGVDVFRALALGATAVLIGRPVCHGLAVAGALGVSHVLRLLRDELEVTMALAGCRTLDDITADCIQPPTLSGSCSSAG
ncbi:alpha-hydroxy acid oxidase [Sagittula stellata]|uniref:Glycolate oxidase, (S)-2-hydroxy-acid oxidase, peroxisomal n=1 Tax=Sagittula stellata (strain ATCC 700073 / DSM 11524 / E-37) TaxID=388399 RepID=A3K4B4_SAGS3|nr:alpha-hydroxy acid oxidase [Sagittula stellata]EBA07813.1 glycolate oxidase, (S)-2-hydroxy-acid oxidase, peroxisomal [Sagittula stellata E-37]